MRIWVTRTEPGATRLASMLASHGFEVFKAPVLGIEPIRSAPPNGPFDLAVFVSEHAVACAFANGWRGGPAMAIGNAAACRLQRHGAPSRWPPQSDAAGAVRALTGSPPGRTLIVKGAGGSDTLPRWLRSEGGAVAEWDVYRRVANRVSIADQRIDAIVAASGDGLLAIGRLWFAEERDAGVPLLVPSERVAGLATDAGFENVTTTLGAGSTAVVDTLGELRAKEEP